MDRPVTVHEMEHVIGGLDGPDFTISNDIGNVIEISDSNDMLGLGMPLLHDKYYPELQPKIALDFQQPLQLLAAELSFIDPLTGQQRRFLSRRELAGWPSHRR